MDGEFICEDFAYQMPGIGGGNFNSWRISKKCN